MKTYRLIFIAFISVLILPLPALEVNRNELTTAGTDENIVFKNYTGPHTKIDTIEEIEGIGQNLGKPIAENPTLSVTVGQTDYYKIIHAIDSTENEGLDADIFIIGKNATVDHIINLRRIISAYLETAYGYSTKDAETLSVFITVYNAVYYTNIDAYTAKYKPIVTDNLNPLICGLSVNYEDWPGKTQIVIPLSKLEGLSTIETSIISDKKVLNSMKEEPEKQIEARKDLVDIKEREADIATEEAQEAQKEATIAKDIVQEEQTVLAEKQQEAIEANEEAEVATKEAEIATKKAETHPEDEQAQQVAKEKQQIAEEKKQVAEEKAQVVEEKKQDVEKAQTEASKKETIASEKQTQADKKQSEAQDERIDIADDQLEIIKEKTKAANIVNITYGLRMTDQEKLLSTLVSIDVDTGLVIKESPVSYIRNRTLLPNGDNYTAIAGETGANKTVKLVTLDKENMEIIDESEFSVSENSVLLSDKNYFYAILQDGDSYVVGKFDTNLDLILKSNLSVMPATPIMLSDDGLLVTDTWGIPKLLRITDLSEVSSN